MNFNTKEEEMEYTKYIERYKECINNSTEESSTPKEKLCYATKLYIEGKNAKDIKKLEHALNLAEEAKSESAQLNNPEDSILMNIYESLPARILDEIVSIQNSNYN